MELLRKINKIKDRLDLISQRIEGGEVTAPSAVRKLDEAASVFDEFLLEAHSFLFVQDALVPSGIEIDPSFTGVSLFTDLLQDPGYPFIELVESEERVAHFRVGIVKMVTSSSHEQHILAAATMKKIVGGGVSFRKSSDIFNKLSPGNEWVLTLFRVEHSRVKTLVAEFILDNIHKEGGLRTDSLIKSIHEELDGPSRTAIPIIFNEIEVSSWMESIITMLK